MGKNTTLWCLVCHQGCFSLLYLGRLLAQWHLQSSSTLLFNYEIRHLRCIPNKYDTLKQYTNYHHILFLSVSYMTLSSGAVVRSISSIFADVTLFIILSSSSSLIPTEKHKPPLSRWEHIPGKETEHFPYYTHHTDIMWCLMLWMPS